MAGKHWPPVHERFWARVDRRSPEDCWLWTGAAGAYGIIVEAGRSIPVHRFAYELLVGPIPAGFDLDHLCRVRLCVNPAHLEPVTHGENSRRWNAYRDRPSPDQIDSREIAERFGFPEPTLRPRGRLFWDRAEVEQWAKATGRLT